MKMLKTTLLLLASAAGFAGVQATADRCTTVKNSYVRQADGYYVNPGVRTFTYTPDQALDQAAIPYVQRLNAALKQKGTQLTMAFIPIIADGLGGSNPAAGHVNPDALAKSYRDVILKPFRDAGINTPDLMTTSLAYSRSNPTDYQRLKTDSHWSPTGIKLFANAIANSVREASPALLNGLPKSEAKVEYGEKYNRVGDIERIVNEACPDIPTAGQDLPKITLTSSGGLLDDNDPETLLLGTSYSARPPGFGFEYFLEEALKTPVVNEAVNGGGPMGAFMNYFSQDNPKFPKLLIWEMPADILHNPYSPMNVLYLRQAIPLVADSTLVKQSKATLTPGATAQVELNHVVKGRGFLALDMGTIKTRIVNLEIQYANGSETLTLNRTHGTNLGRFTVEFDQPDRQVKAVKVTVPDLAAASDIGMSIYQYR